MKLVKFFFKDYNTSLFSSGQLKYFIGIWDFFKRRRTFEFWACSWDKSLSISDWRASSSWLSEMIPSFSYFTVFEKFRVLFSSDCSLQIIFSATTREKEPFWMSSSTSCTSKAVAPRRRSYIRSCSDFLKTLSFISSLGP